ncbi:glycosyltransferase family 2 protein [Candidatus Omnitrophota bacterium]
MSKKPLVSIVMPVYNAMPYLEQAVQSIYAQTFTDWELIAVDDCSIDDSWDYLQRIDDSRVRLLRNSGNRKQSYTQNCGIDMARGKYIARMDADDLSLPQRLEKQIEALEVDPEIDVLGCGSFRTNENLDILGVVRYPTTHEAITRIISFDLRFFYGANFKMTHGTMVGKNEWFRRWKADPKVLVAQDFDMVCRAQKYSRFANIPESLYVYRTGGVTMPWHRQTRAACYKAQSLMRNGFYYGNNIMALIGIVALMQRPFVVAVKKCLNMLSGDVRTLANQATSSDGETLKSELSKIALIDVPLRTK